MAKSKKQQYQINRQIEQLLDKKGVDHSQYSTEELEMLKQYAGYGGLGNLDDNDSLEGSELLYEYYTPDAVIDVMWGLLLKHGFDGGKVLEPSCGTGRFFALAPQTLNPIEFTGFEISKYSSKIAQLLYPDAIIKKQYFEQAFIKNRDSLKSNVNAQFKAVIGNPPYGGIGKGGLYLQMGEKQYTKAKRYEDYFITRSLDLLNEGGLLCFIIGVSQGKTFLASDDNPTKQTIAGKAEILEAYKLPSGVFPYTDVVAEIILLRKLG